MLTSGLDTHILCIYMYKCLLYTHAYLFKKKKKTVIVTHLIPAGRFLSSRLALVYRANSRIARAIQKNPVSPTPFTPCHLPKRKNA